MNWTYLWVEAFYIACSGIISCSVNAREVNCSIERIVNKHCFILIRQSNTTSGFCENVCWKHERGKFKGAEVVASRKGSKTEAETGAGLIDVSAR